MFRWKMTALFAAVICAAVLCCACTAAPEDTTPVTEPPTAPTVDPLVQAFKEDPTAFVEFSRSTAPREGYVPITELMEYESIYPKCNGTWFRDQLTGEDLLIYNSYLYALEHRYTWFKLYVEDSDKDFSYIREALSLDSPFLEQNFSHYEYTHKNPINYRGESASFSMEQFTDSRWEMKQEALEKCRQIVAGIPAECVTQEQKMLYLYKYVCDHVEYVDYEKMADEDHLYDAVCKGEAVCDGYSNMLNLLFNLIGVECCEAMGDNVENWETATEEEIENANGHTWVVAKLDGQFYNFDPTFEDGDEDDWGDGTKYFGYSDNLVSVKYLDCEELRPKCTDISRDFPYADMVVTDANDSAQSKELSKCIKQRMKDGLNETVVAVHGDLSDKQVKSFVRKCLDRIGSIKEAQYNWEPMRGSVLIQITVTPR